MWYQIECWVPFPAQPNAKSWLSVTVVFSFCSLEDNCEILVCHRWSWVLYQSRSCPEDESMGQVSTVPSWAPLIHGWEPFKHVSYALCHSLGNFISTAERVRLPDDCTIGYIIEGLLEVKLLHSPLFHSHLENLQRLQGEAVLQQVGLCLMSCSYSYTSVWSERVLSVDLALLSKEGYLQTHSELCPAQFPHLGKRCSFILASWVI